MLTERRYFQASLAAPFALPLAIGLMALLTRSELLDGFAAIFMFSLMLGGIPYLIFAAGVVLWSRTRPISAIRRLSYIAPVLFVAVAAVLSLTARLFGVPLREIGMFIAAFSVFGLLFGYLYVFMVNFLYEIIFAERSGT